MRDTGVLLVEDEPSISVVVSRALGARGWPVESAITGEQALAALASSQPGVLVLDINLPDITGWEVLRRLSPAKREETPVIVYSAAPPAPERVAEFRPAGVLTKPFPMDALLRLVASAADSVAEHGAADAAVRGADVQAASQLHNQEIVVAGRDLRWIMRTVAQAESLATRITAVHRDDPVRAAQKALIRRPAALVVAVPAGTTLDALRPLLDPTVPTRRLLVLAEEPEPGLRQLAGLCGSAIASVDEPPVLLAATLIALLTPEAA